MYINYTYPYKTNPTINYLENNVDDIEQYGNFELLLSDIKITTNNFNDYFKNYKIISITPYLNPIFKSKLKTDLTYNFKNIKLNNNLNNFIAFYEKQIRNSGYTQNIEMIYYQGIKIDKVVIFTNLKNIYELTEKYPKIKYNVL